MATEKSNEQRVRNWCAVVYPSENWYKTNRPDGKYDGNDGWGSAPDDWQKQLDSLNLKWSCSPLHDSDVDDEGTIKKPHWHIIICYGGNKSINQVTDDLQMLNCPRPQICRDVRSSVRYFVHKDHPHKFQYSQSDIVGFGGFDVAECFNFSASEEMQVLDEMCAYIEDNDIVEFYEFSAYCRRYRRDDWFPILAKKSTIFIKEFIKSNRHRQRDFVLGVDGKMVEIDKDGVVVERKGKGTNSEN